MEGLFVDYIPVYILKHKGSDCSNGGISHNYDEAYLCLNGRRPSEKENEKSDKPFIAIVAGNSRGTLKAVPITLSGAPKGGMAGGCYVASCDSRFSKECSRVLGLQDINQPFYGAVSLHDRFE